MSTSEIIGLVRYDLIPTVISGFAAMLIRSALFCDITHLYLTSQKSVDLNLIPSLLNLCRKYNSLILNEKYLTPDKFWISLLLQKTSGHGILWNKAVELNATVTLPTPQGNYTGVWMTLLTDSGFVPVT
jgi:hypothetical protein